MRRNKSIILSLCISIFISKEGFTQLVKDKKEEINITSTFKPSIIPSSKIEFRPESLTRDTSAYKLKYSPVKLSFTTPMSGFTIKPLAYLPKPTEMDSTQLSLRLGYGNLSSPDASVSYASIKQQQSVSAHADFLSMKGKLPFQHHSIGNIGLNYKQRVSENYQYKFAANIKDYNYMTYGFEANPSIPLLELDLKQHFTNFNVMANLTNVAGEEGRVSVEPILKFDYLTTNYRFNSIAGSLTFPIQYKWKKNIAFKSIASIDWIHASYYSKTPSNNVLIKMPLGMDVGVNKWILDMNLFPIYTGNKVNILPNAVFHYTLNKDRSSLKGGFKSNYEIISPYKLLLYNPFVRPVVNMPVYQQQSIFLGLESYNTNGFSIQGQAGYVFHKNLPLYVNGGILGKDFLPLFESSVKTIELSSQLSYAVSSSLKFSTDWKFTHFTQQASYTKAFGLLPFDMKLGFNWMPISSLTLNFNTNLWTGAYAKNPITTAVIKMKTVADINLDLNYKLNQKWGLWIDLNNIANIQYQRWNQYTAYGFNFRGGLKYILGTTSKN